MKCPACSSVRVYHSRAKSLRDQTVKRILPISFYRCHECGWRRAKLKKMTGKEIALNLPGIAVKWALPGKLWPHAAGVPDKERKLAAEQHAHELAELHQQVETSPTTTV